MNELVYPRERTLATITLVLGLLGWTLLILGTFFVALLFVLFGFIIYLFAQSAMIAYIKGNGVELSERQFPELYAQFAACCHKLDIRTRPEAYILNGNGGLNAFATRFLNTRYVVLFSDVIDAMDQHPDGVRFYMGHELGHLRMKHLEGDLLRWPALWLPLLGGAYARAKESTCDRHGAACSSSPENATRALAALSAGSARWRTLNVSSYVDQADHSTGFWMSFHELNSGYPWLTKRAARLMNRDAAVPARHPLAYLLALFVPYAGRMGAGFGVLILVYIVGVMAAIAIPQYTNYINKASLVGAMVHSEPARSALGTYYTTKRAVPATLESAGIDPRLADGSVLSLNAAEMILTVRTRKNLELIYTPSIDDDGKIAWNCSGGEGVEAGYLPPDCK